MIELTVLCDDSNDAVTPADKDAQAIVAIGSRGAAELTVLPMNEAAGQQVGGPEYDASGFQWPAT